MRPHAALANAHTHARSVLAAAGIGSLGLLCTAAAAPPAGAAPSVTHAAYHASFNVRQILSGASLHHTFTVAGSGPKTDSLSNPDDITRLGHDLFVGFQNGVGPQGETSTDGNLDSTVVEFTLTGHPVAQWDVVGKTDGVTADPKTRTVLATVNEDANSALYVIDPGTGSSAGSATRYAYNEPLPHAGGSDAISILDGTILISASAPGTSGAPAPQATYPAVYSVSLNPGTKVATVTPLFSDEATAIVVNQPSPRFGQSTKLALTDPDSNEVVPPSAARFPGYFMLTSQGDLQQIYVEVAGGLTPKLSVLTLSQSVDDTAWPTDPAGRLYSTDSTHDTVDVVTGPFTVGQPVVAATPCGANDAPGTCPGPGFPANFLATLNPWSGQVSPVNLSGAPYSPEGGLVFVAGTGDNGGQ
jgi:hypothetical protein